MFNRLIEIINGNRLLYQYQFGFILGQYQQRFNTAIDTILSGFYNNDITIGVLIGFSKAFVIVKHHILINKLFKYGIHEWINNFTVKHGLIIT